MDFKNIKFIKKIYREADIERTEKKIRLLGVNCKHNANVILNFQLFSTLVLFVLLILFINISFIYVPIIAILYYKLFYYFILDYQIKKRSKRLDIDAVYFFEVLTLSIESGRNLEGAIELTCSNIDSELSTEFKRVLADVKLGKSLTEALDELRTRIPSETINNIILNITQSNIFGNSIIETMYNQIDFLNDKRILEVKSEINKIPTKISIISIVFFIPLILILILSPLLLNFIA